MENLKNLYELYDKVRNGNKDVYDALRTLGVGMETKVSYDDTQESFISAVIQSPLKESFDELIKSSLANLGEKKFNSVVNRFLISSSIMILSSFSNLSILTLLTANLSLSPLLSIFNIHFLSIACGIEKMTFVK